MIADYSSEIKISDLIAIATSRGRPPNEYWDNYPHQYTYQTCKVSQDRSRIFWDIAMATNFVSYRTCSLGAEVSQDPLVRFSQSLHHMVGIGLQMINLIFFLRLRDVAMPTN